MPSAGIRGRSLSRQPRRHEILKSKLCHTLVIGMTSSGTSKEAHCFARLARESVYHPPKGGCFTALSRSLNTITGTGGGHGQHGQREKSNSRHQDWEASGLAPSASCPATMLTGARRCPSAHVLARTNRFGDVDHHAPQRSPSATRGFVPARGRLCVGLVSGKFCGPSRMQTRSSTRQFSIHAGALIHVPLAPCIPPGLRSPPVLRCPCPLPAFGRSGPGADRSGCPCARGGPERYPHDP